MTDLKVILASTSEIKRRAVLLGCKRAGIPVDIQLFKASSGVPEQPFGLAQTYEGALNRLRAARAAHADHVCIAIENGIVELATNVFVDLGVVILEDSNGLQSTATSAGVDVSPADVAEACHKGCTVGEVVAKARGGHANDPHSVLLSGRLSREELLARAVQIAILRL